MSYDSASKYFDVTGFMSLTSGNWGGPSTGDGYGWSSVSLTFKSAGVMYPNSISYDTNGDSYPRIISGSGGTSGTMRFLTSQLPPNIATASDLTMVAAFSRFGGPGS
jgi:hypothetical protein